MWSTNAKSTWVERSRFNSSCSFSTCLRASPYTDAALANIFSLLFSAPYLQQSSESFVPVYHGYCLWGFNQIISPYTKFLGASNSWTYYSSKYTEFAGKKKQKSISTCFNMLVTYSCKRFCCFNNFFLEVLEQKVVLSISINRTNMKRQSLKINLFYPKW